MFVLFLSFFSLLSFSMECKFDKYTIQVSEARQVTVSGDVVMKIHLEEDRPSELDSVTVYKIGKPEHKMTYRLECFENKKAPFRRPSF